MYRIRAGITQAHGGLNKSPFIKAWSLRPVCAGGGTFFRESLIDSDIHADGIFLCLAASQKPRNSGAIPSVSFLAGRKNLLVIAKTSLNQWFLRENIREWLTFKGYIFHADSLPMLRQPVRKMIGNTFALPGILRCCFFGGRIEKRVRYRICLS